MKIQPIVEGHGEKEAVPVLLRRFINDAGLYHLEVGKPIRRPRSQLVSEAPLKLAVRLASIQPECGAILIIFDADDQCPAECAPKIRDWAKEEAGHIPSAVVLANREYEAWFLAALGSLRGARSIRQDAVFAGEAESVRDAKGRLSDQMETGDSYAETVDQAALTQRFDMRSAYATCRSFRKMAKAFGDLAHGMRMEINAWPPPDWVEGS